MDKDKLPIEKCRYSIPNKPPVNDSCFEIGKCYFIRTVTMHLVGKLEQITTQELLLSSASWIASSGNFHDAMKSGKLDEVEPFVNPIIVGRGALIDATEWKHELPREQE